MKKFQALKIFALAFIFVGEPILFKSGIFFSALILVLEHTWPIQAVAGFGWMLLNMDPLNWSIPRRLMMLVLPALFFGLAGISLWSISVPEPRYPFPLQAALGFCLVFIGLMVIITGTSTSLVARRVIIVALVLPFCGMMSLLSWGGKQIRNIAWSGNDHYYLTISNAASVFCDLDCNFTALELYKCDSFGLGCNRIVSRTVDGRMYNDTPITNLVVDKDANELLLFVSAQGSPHGLFYVDGKQSRFIVDSADEGEKIFYLATGQERKPFTYQLLECNRESMGCRFLPFEYVIEGDDDLLVDVDDMGRVEVVNVGFSHGDFLVYTYNLSDGKPVCYVKDCQSKVQ